MLNGRMSGLDRFWTICSSSWLLLTMKTIKPFLSKSNDSDRVRGSAGDPAMTTTSTRPPLRALLARRDFLHRALLRYDLYATVPDTTTINPTRILCLEIQFWARSSADVGMVTMVGGGGGCGRNCSGTHSDLAMVSRSVPAIWST